MDEEEYAEWCNEQAEAEQFLREEEYNGREDKRDT